jgi:hypothetical protein
MFEYKPTPSGIKFHDSDAPIKMIMGPFGSGKSTIAAMDILYNALAQHPADDGVRYSRWGVIRASYPSLKDTTRKTIMEIMPQGSGYLTMGNAPLHGVFSFALPDKTRVQIEFELWSSETAEDAEKFRSSNWTGVWLNEATEISFDVLMGASTRIDRFPQSHLGGCRWGGIIMDFNRPEKGHWIETLFNKPEIALESDSKDPSVFPIFSITQPPAAFKLEIDGVTSYTVNTLAENLDNLRGGTAYYARQIAMYQQAGNTDAIDALYCLLEVTSKQGKPVWPMFDVKKHVAPKKIDPIEGAPLLIGYDSSGIHQAAVFLQHQNGKWCVTDELYGDREGFSTFVASGIIPLVAGRYPRSEVTVSYDPADASDSFTGLTPSVHLRNAGFLTAPRVTNRITTRIAAVATMLNIEIGGLLVSPHCKMVIEAMEGGDGVNGYHFVKKRLRGSIDVIYSEEPEKNDASHIADALQYAALHVNKIKENRGPEVSTMKKLVSKWNSVKRRLMPA